VSVRTNFDGSGTDRVVITWADGAIKNQWLEVQVLPTLRTGLTATDVFFWGNKIGDVGTPSAVAFATTAAGDAAAIVGHIGAGGGITDVYDIDRSNVITGAGDRAAAVANIGGLARINIGTGGPFAPEDGGDATLARLGAGSAIAVALAAPAGSPIAPQALPAVVRHRMARVEDSSRAWIGHFEQLGSLHTHDEAIVVESEDFDELLESLASAFSRV
jgi:hypothetical protein